MSLDYGDPPSGPVLFEEATNELNDLSNLRDPYGEEADTARRHLDTAAALTGMAQVAAIVMLTEVICTATGSDHPELDAWREVLPLARCVPDDTEES